MIFHTHKGYPEIRNILKTPEVEFSQTIDIFKFISHFSFKFLKKIPTWSLNLYFNPFVSKNNIIHFFNGICLSRQKWISTFETSLPRLGKVPALVERIAVKKMAASNCIKLLALSNCSYNIQKRYLQQNWPGYLEKILNKTIVLHPPQPLLINNLRDKPSIKNGLVFTFVGNQFFGKGGKEILNVFNSTLTD
ncbi:hypothetical protein [Thermophagus xiamenensis]|uniref:Uncharacterized protein n=1 Tax=Thermophagus xiamenensis TaxID=385682 RepID=A0A1I2G1Q3_9BACT|nr:hypothetical protein [Thermophagus xiamenensis]SFF11023.1 hypothetical protein SAMN05444380_1444 [Thermophagus xiamenensis]